MADSKSSAVVEDTSTNANQGSLVAPPKFVFGQNMSERIKTEDETQGDLESDPVPQYQEKSVTEVEEGKNSDSENSPLHSEKNVTEVEEGNRNAVVKKRTAESDDKKDVTEDDGPLSPVKKVARVFHGSSEEENEPKQFKLKPSILTEVAKNLTGASNKGENSNTTSSLPKTFGLSTSESTSTENRKGATAPEPLSGQSTKNYFQMFLDKNDKANDSQKSGSFVFGRNMVERVVLTAGGQDKDSSPEKEDESLSTTENKSLTEGEPKTLAEVARACADKEGPDSPHDSPDKQHMTLAEAANVYQKMTPCKSQLEEVEVVTGEEKERNVMQINCKLFLFDGENHSWREKGRGFLKLNDMRQSTSESTFQSRLVMRTQGHLRVMLNSKLWPEMTLDRANDKSLRITVMEAENDVKIYLIMAGPKDIQQLYTAIDRRIQALRREKEMQKENSKSTEDHVNTDNDTESEKKEETEADGSSRDDRVAPSPDESSNDSCSNSREPARSKDNSSDDDE
ncbi:ran-binding protein 3-like isoform X2 [Actinia tenebrosa]|uniref:Ran-binding protein 3-like isoform X2 n=1 Tax=Actinia tenebrosa TaxID=6105 RepID=A0A6P8HG27_ACTTE|nr:ran-binding protein 3-like isoform X2 [Actinia tenebrosa]